MVFENSVPKANFGQNIRDSPNGSLTADSRSLQTATHKSACGNCLTNTIKKMAGVRKKVTESTFKTSLSYLT